MTVLLPVRAQTHDDLSALVVVPNVEILEVGENWLLSTGPTTFTPEDLASAVASQDDPAIRAPILKLGHTDRRPGFDGQPCFGKLINLRTDNDGMTLVADVAGVPRWLADIWPTAYPSRSMEGYWEWPTATGNKWPFVLTALALLGEVEPAIETLADLPLAFGLVAAQDPAPPRPGATRFVGTQVPGDPLAVVLTEAAPVRAGAMRAHSTETSDRSWDGAAQWRNIPNVPGVTAEAKAAIIRRAVAWTATDFDENPTQGRAAFIHHFVTPAGEVGEASTVACPAAIGVLNGARGVEVADQPWAGDRSGIHAHMKRHLVDAGVAEEDVPELMSIDDVNAARAAAAAGPNGADPPQPARPVHDQRSGAAAAAVSYEDVRRAFYDQLGPGQMWWWIRELVIDPAELIVVDEEDHLYQVPYTTSSEGTVEFGDPTEVRIEYVAASQGAPQRDGVTVFASRDDSREGVTDVDLNPLRQRLGVPADMPDEEVLTLAAQRLPDPGQPPGGSTPAPDASQSQPAPQPAPQGAPPSAPTPRPATSTDAGAPPAGTPQGTPPTGQPAAEPVGTPAPPAPGTPAPGTPVPSPAPATTGTQDGAQPAQDAAQPAATGTPAPPAGQAAPQPAMAAGAQLPPGMVAVDANVWQQTVAGAQQGAAIAQRLHEQDRTTFIDGVVRAGRLSPTNTELRQHLEREFDRSPDGARRLAASLAPAFPVGELGHAQGGELTTELADASDLAVFPELAHIRQPPQQRS